MHGNFLLLYLGSRHWIDQSGGVQSACPSVEQGKTCGRGRQQWRDSSIGFGGTSRVPGAGGRAFVAAGFECSNLAAQADACVDGATTTAAPPSGLTPPAYLSRPAGCRWNIWSAASNLASRAADGKGKGKLVLSM
jgi:hypothetical protein